MFQLKQMYKMYEMSMNEVHSYNSSNLQECDSSTSYKAPVVSAALGKMH